MCLANMNKERNIYALPSSGTGVNNYLLPGERAAPATHTNGEGVMGLASGEQWSNRRITWSTRMPAAPTPVPNPSSSGTLAGMETNGGTRSTV